MYFLLIYFNLRKPIMAKIMPFKYIILWQREYFTIVHDTFNENSFLRRHMF